MHFVRQCMVSVNCCTVCPSVCHTHALWQNQTMYCAYFNTSQNGSHPSFLTPTLVGGQCPLPSGICTQSDPPPFEKCRLRQISAYNISTVRDCEKVQLWQIGSQPWAFRWAIDGVHMLPLSPIRGGSKGEFFVFRVKVNGWSFQALST